MRTKEQIESSGEMLENTALVAEISDIIADTLSEQHMDISGSWRSLGFIYLSNGHLSCPLDVSRSYSGAITNDWPYIKSTFAHRSGARSVLMWPVARDKCNGRPVHMYYPHGHNIEDVAKDSGFSLPSFPQKEGWSFGSGDMAYVYSTDAKARYTEPARAVSALNKWLKVLHIPALSQSVTNPMLAKIACAIEGAKPVVCWLDDEPISEIYSNECSMPYVSCMSGERASFFEVYDHLQRGGVLRIAGLFLGEERIGRSLVWTDEGRHYIDRLYMPDKCGEPSPAGVAAFAEFCEREGIEKSVFKKTADLLSMPHACLALPVTFDLDDFSEWPYIDSMRYFCSDGKLRNCENCWTITKFESTEGSHSYAEEEENGEYVTLNNGDRVHMDDATYVEQYGDYYHNDDVVEVDGSHYGHDMYRLLDDCTYTYDDRYVLSDDAVELTSGDYAGDYAHEDETCILHDESVALIHECVETKIDGKYVWTLKQ